MEEPLSISDPIAVARVFAKKPFPRGSIKTEKCPICGGADYTEDLLGEDTNWAGCKGCGTAFKMYFPSNEEQFEFYRDQYRLNETGPDYPLGSHRRTHVFRFGRQFSLLANGLEQHKKFLDYGCALGWSVHAAEFIGLDAYGVEAGKMDRKFAMDTWGLKLYETLEELPVRDFDLILMSHVLEHFIDPIAELKKLYNDYMAPEGRIIIEVPTQRTPSAWSGFHAVLFNAGSLVYSLVKAGFDLAMVRSSETDPQYPSNLMWTIGRKGG